MKPQYAKKDSSFWLVVNSIPEVPDGDNLTAH